MIGGLNGMKGLDPRRRRERREPEPVSLGCAGVCLETLMVPSDNKVTLYEIEFWSGPGYTGTKLTGTPYATKDSGGGSAANAFDGSGLSWWSADLSTGPAKIGIATDANLISYAGTLSGFVTMPPPMSFRMLAYSGVNWCSAFRLYTLDVFLTGDQVALIWKVAGEFTDIPSPGPSNYGGVDL